MELKHNSHIEHLKIEVLMKTIIVSMQQKKIICSESLKIKTINFSFFFNWPYFFINSSHLLFNDFQAEKKAEKGVIDYYVKVGQGWAFVVLDLSRTWRTEWRCMGDDAGLIK